MSESPTRPGDPFTDQFRQTVRTLVRESFASIARIEREHDNELNVENQAVMKEALESLAELEALDLLSRLEAAETEEQRDEIIAPLVKRAETLARSAQMLVDLTDEDIDQASRVWISGIAAEFPESDEPFPIGFPMPIEIVHQIIWNAIPEDGQEHILREEEAKYRLQIPYLRRPKGES